MTTGLVSTFASHGVVSRPSSLVVDAEGIVYIADGGSGQIFSINQSRTVTTLGILNGKSNERTMIGLAITSTGSLVVAESASNSVSILNVAVEYPPIPIRINNLTNLVLDAFGGIEKSNTTIATPMVRKSLT